VTVRSKLSHFFHSLRGQKQVELKGYHCGCCGAWVDEPKTVWRKGGRLHSMDPDTWGLCLKCAEG